jgi:2-iminobutanoate/2-iminopropanoate deaminase
MREVRTTEAPTPAGHYAQAIVHEGVVYAAGQLPIDPATGERLAGTVEEQTERALENLAAVLRAAGSGLEHALKVTVYVADIDLWSRVNTVYARVFGEHRPARTVVPTSELHHGLLVEVDAIAATATGGG